MELEASLSSPRVAASPPDFPNMFHPWMAMSFGQFKRTEEWLHKQILLNTIRNARRAERFQIGPKPIVEGTFDGVRQIMWRHRCTGVVGYSSLLVEYQVCDVGYAREPLITGKLEFWHCH